MDNDFQTLKTQFTLLGDAAGLKLLRRAGRRAGQYLRDRAAERAPVGRTGRLRDEMGTRTRKETVSSIEVEVGPSKDAFYGRFQEAGTRFHRAQPFLSPAIEQHGDEAAAIFSAELDREIGNAFRKTFG